MADSIFNSIFGALNKQTLNGIASSLGESEQSVSRGLQSSIATMLGGISSKSNDPSALRRILDMAPNTSGDVTWSQAAASISNPNSPLLTAGKNVLSGLFGTSENTVSSAIARESGLRQGVTSTLMAMAAPLVMSFLGKRIRDEGMSVSGIGSLLNRESDTIRGALPSGLSEMFWPRGMAATAATSPVVAQTVHKEGHAGRWLLGLGLAALCLGLLWHFTRQPRFTRGTGTASRVAELGDFMERRLPGNYHVRIPQRGMESRLLGFVENPNMPVNDTTWFRFDRLTFDTGSANIRPESREQLSNIATIMKAYPNVHLKAGGFTDNVGDATQNLQLSRDRANRVMAELVQMGVSPDRLEAEGYGSQYPVADNTTESGREQNRRVSMQVTRK